MAIVGIDLGTTNSVISTMEHGRVEVIPNVEGKLTTPSVVFFQSSGLDDALVGESAVFSIGSDPARGVRLIKRHMGSDYEFQIDGRSYTPEEISAAILKKLKTDAEQFGGEPVTHAVVTVPAYFGPQEREATKRAAEGSGLSVLALIPEPIAAAIDFAETQGESLADQTVLVYDLGGGTFDVTVMQVEKKGDSLSFRILGKDGSIELGGADWDEKLAEHVAREFAAANEGQNPLDDPISTDRLLMECQKAKETLSVKPKPDDTVQITCTHQGIMHTATVSRRELEQMTEALMNQTIDKASQLVDSLFGDANTPGTNPWDEIDMILLAGGSTKMASVCSRLHELSGKQPRTNRGVDLNVGRGAAYFAFSPDAWTIDADEMQPALKGEAMAHGPKGKIALAADVVNYSIGVEAVNPTTAQDMYHRIIKIGLTVGEPAEQEFGLWQNGQTGIDLRIYREPHGDTTDKEERELSEVELLGAVRIDGLPPTSRKGDPVLVRLQVSADGLIVGECVYMPTGTKGEIRVELEPKKSREQA